MRPTNPKPLGDYFKEGITARECGKAIHDNPYSAGSRERHEWDAGFRATTDVEDEDDLDLDPNENAKRRNPD